MRQWSRSRSTCRSARAPPRRQAVSMRSRRSRVSRAGSLPGGQPGAGKSYVVAQLSRADPDAGQVILTGDALRPFHPHHATLLRTDPYGMPNATGPAVATWVGGRRMAGCSTPFPTCPRRGRLCRCGSPQSRCNASDGGIPYGGPSNRRTRADVMGRQNGSHGTGADSLERDTPVGLNVGRASARNPPLA
jgi:hypothetical protein